MDNKYNVKKYEIGGTITNGLLICYNDGEYTTPLETVYDEETRTLSADISSEGIYFVLDVMGWLDLMGVDLSEEENFSITPAARRKSANNVSKSDISIADSKIKAQVDIVFVIDTTGSMGSYITNVKTILLRLLMKLRQLVFHRLLLWLIIETLPVMVSILPI